jgi:hypothetical protein
MNASAARMLEDAAALVPFSRMLEPQKAAALEALAAEVARAGAAPGLVARLAGLLRRAPDGALFVELEIPRLSFYPSSAWIGQGFFETWELDIVAKPLPGGLGVADAFWISAQSTITALAAGVALVADPERSPIAELDRRRADIEQRRKEAATSSAAAGAERERAEAADRAWLRKNDHRVARWRKLPRLLQDIAVAAAKTGDPVLIEFAKQFAEASAAAWPPDRPPDFLWPLSG